MGPACCTFISSSPMLYFLASLRSTPPHALCTFEATCRPQCCPPAACQGPRVCTRLRPRRHSCELVPLPLQQLRKQVKARLRAPQPEPVPAPALTSRLGYPDDDGAFRIVDRRIPSTRRRRRRRPCRRCSGARRDLLEDGRSSVLAAHANHEHPAASISKPGTTASPAAPPR